MLECESVRFPVLLVFFSDMGRPLSEPWPVATFEELFREEIPASVFGSSPSMSKFVFFPALFGLGYVAALSSDCCAVRFRDRFKDPSRMENNCESAQRNKAAQHLSST